MPEVLMANVYEQMKHKQHLLEARFGHCKRANNIHNLLQGCLQFVLEGEKQQKAAQEAAA